MSFIENESLYRPLGRTSSDAIKDKHIGIYLCKETQEMKKLALNKMVLVSCELSHP